MTHTEQVSISLYLDKCTFKSEDREVEQIPHKTLVSIWDFIIAGNEPSGFTYACLANDFVEAASTADGRNAPALPAIARHIYSFVPESAWGSEEAVRDWISRDGYLGRHTISEAERLISGRLKETPGHTLAEIDHFRPDPTDEQPA